MKFWVCTCGKYGLFQKDGWGIVEVTSKVNSRNFLGQALSNGVIDESDKGTLLAEVEASALPEESSGPAEDLHHLVVEFVGFIVTQRRRG
jgi:aspartokinase-like uncharacterized kinase